jgi:amino acid adenylation domain-containing protein
MTGSLPALLRASAERHPGRVAVSCGKQRLEYAPLLRRAASLATVLAGQGVRAGDRVAVSIDKSVDVVVAVWGVLLAGAAYVPLDPGGPPERAGRILADCGLRHIVTSAARRGRLREIVAAGSPLRAAVLLDTDEAQARAELVPLAVALRGDVESAAPAAPVDCGGQGLAYILYTSGSTGQPKGVAISHAAALAFVEWAGDRFALTAEDALSWHAPLQFDLSVFDLFASARAGARIGVVTTGMSVFPQSLARWIESERITTWYSVPSILIQLARHGDLPSRDLSALRQVLFAGEPFPAPRLRELMALLPAARFHNLYGPTETNVCTWHAVSEPPAPDASVPIGVPVAGDVVHLVGEDGRPVADGQMGEVAVSGPTLMQGYWNDAAKTAGVLRAWAPPGGRPETTYFTGDLGRRRADGVLEYHGRRDGMVKTRGYRVELGEVEAALHGHPDVGEAVAYPVPHEELGHRILAVVVAREGRTVDGAAVRRHCAEKLPAYMIPDEVEVASEPLPRTPNGKVDRRAIAESRTDRGA